ncbi:MAG TPA: hypothetical protein VER76_14375 [Pyrinomonadaceae bacterium]|nr:hypothetical protein [Pyrinomonadaceae bacterium]
MKSSPAIVSPGTINQKRRTFHTGAFFSTFKGSLSGLFLSIIRPPLIYTL